MLTNIVTSCHWLALRVTAATLAVTNDSKGHEAPTNVAPATGCALAMHNERQHAPD